MATSSANPRKKHLDAISTKIATFLVTETYTDEPELQEKLAAAIKLLDEVAEKCVKNDEAYAAAQTQPKGEPK